MEKIKLEYPIDQYFTWKDVLATTMEKYSSNSYLEYWKRPEDEHPSSLTYRQVDTITTSLAQRLESEFKIRGTPVAYLANHSLQYALYLMAFVKLECRLLLLSPRNSEPALVDLMNKTNTKVLLYANQFSKVATKVSSNISDGAFNLASEVDIEQALQEENMAEKSLLASKSTSKEQLEDIAMIIHSSGTTGFPKPIYLSNRYLIMLFDGYNKIYQNVPTPKLLSFAPLFHVMGSAMFAMAVNGGTYVFPINVSIIQDHLYAKHEDALILLLAVPTS
jgi:acyl-CoA synthetase (AMP-forming)/AMP-acid ligase II